jgi:transcriptional regulator with XRE-family HTH domain
MSIRLKQLRRQRRWSLETLAGNTGLTKSYLSKVERGISVPSISVAIKLAKELAINVEELFSDNVSESEIAVTRSSERTSFGTSNNEKPSVQSIASGAAAKKMLPFVLYPASDFEASAFKEHEGEEFLFVHSGTVEVAFPTGTYELAAGDSLYFNSLAPHKIRSIGSTQAEVLVVVSHDDA